MLSWPTRKAAILIAVLTGFFLGFLFLQSLPFASANIYSFRDENGVTHFSNLPHLDKRYRLVYRIPTAGQFRQVVSREKPVAPGVRQRVRAGRIGIERVGEVRDDEVREPFLWRQ